MTHILNVCGTPNEETLNKIASVEARNYVKMLVPESGKKFKELFRGCASPLPIDLLEKMLDLDAEKRISAAEALAHPYLSQWADPSDEPESLPYDQTFEDYELPVEKWKEYIWNEVQSFSKK